METATKFDSGKPRASLLPAKAMRWLMHEHSVGGTGKLDKHMCDRLDAPPEQCAMHEARIAYTACKLMSSSVWLFPGNGVLRVTEVLTFGAKKYAANQWQKVPNAVERYTDALYRHWLMCLGGEVNDLESGLPHLAHLACNAMFLLHFREETPDGQ